MDKYGLTKKGPNIKRLDKIIEEMHDDLSKEWGVNTRQNPQSIVNHIITNVADRLAELWEFGEDVYYSFYPSTAEGISLDNVTQLGGTIRRSATKSFYPIHCTGVDGTQLSKGTMISSNTNPTTLLSITEEKSISRDTFNKATIRVVNAKKGQTYQIGLNGEYYSYVSTSDDANEILYGLLDRIDVTGFTFNVEKIEDDLPVLKIECSDLGTNNRLSLNSHLTTDTVTTVINFGTENAGDILIPEGAITNIVKADAGLSNVINLCSYIAGRDEETDIELRKSYADKIFNRSSMMLESIKSAILKNVQGVESVSGYENNTNETDALGRPPHSIEMIVDGGDNTKIAQQILDHKAGGISTFGREEILLPGINGEEIKIRFNRPVNVYVWLQISLSLKTGTMLTESQVSQIKDIIIEQTGQLNAGDDIVPQKYISDLYKTCPDISYIEINLYSTENKDEEPVEYPYKSIEVTPRQRAVITEDMIEVVINE